MAGGHVLARLDAYLEGALPTRPRSRVAGHLERCPECRSVAAQRAAVLTAARSVGARPAAQGPVMRERGVSGRLAAGLLTGLILLSAVITAAWVAGAPRSPVTATRTDPAHALSTVQGADTRTAAAAAVARLRSEGWTVPSLVPAGLEPLDVDAERRGDGVEVTVVWGGTEPAVTVRECRAEPDPTEPGPTEPGRAETGGQGAADCGAGTVFVEAQEPDGTALGATPETGSLPLGVAYRIADLPTGEWEAELAVSGAVYRVRARLPRPQAETLLTQVVVADRSGLTELRHDDDPGDRLERGLSRLAEAVPTGVLVGRDGVVAEG